jgi:predicted AAA+ superfamily ATPase
MSAPIVELRRLIQENSRIQKGSSIEIDYVDVTHALADAKTRQNHVVFGRRGCGKSLLLEKVRKGLGQDIRAIYINCEDYKHHSFPNVLVEILDAVFTEIEEHLGGWFGKKKRLKSLVAELRNELSTLRTIDPAR